MFKLVCLLFVIGCTFAEPPQQYLPPNLSLFVQLNKGKDVVAEVDALIANSSDPNFVVDGAYLPPANGNGNGNGNANGAPPSGTYGPPSGSYGPPNGNGNGNGYPPPVYGPPEDATEPAKYSFEWEVNDPESGNEYGQKEERDGDDTKGSYNVLLPDGRKQIVEYTVDKDGYHPVITYEEPKNGGYPAAGKPNGNGNGNGGYRY